MLRLTIERERQGRTKADLARAARLDQALLSKIEAGRIRPYDVELRRLARALGMSPKDATTLLDDVPTVSPARARR